MARQNEFPMMPKKLRKTPVKRAHISDAGIGDADFPYGAQFTCKRCSWISEWLLFNNNTDIRRGVPCPNCNA